VPVAPGIRRSARLQRRLGAVVGDRWALLPQTYAFFEPLFSTGLAWSLVCVERLADVLVCLGDERSRQLARYGALVEQEADHQQRLIEVTTRSRRSFETFRSTSFLYFAAASFNELRQRLVPYRGAEQSWAWDGFLGAAHSGLRDLLLEAEKRLDGCAAAYGSWVQAAIEPYNLIGIGERSDHLYGVDLDCVVDRCDFLGLGREEMVALLPRLRGQASKG
jgi:FADH2 O2-dependent halogenase